jgi:hypothetical protein
MLPKVSEGADREEKREWLSDLVRIVILIWSAGLLTASYVRLPSGQKIMDFDPTFIASVFSGSLAGFGIAAAKAGAPTGANGSAPAALPEAPIYAAKKEEEKTEPEVQPVWSEPEPTPEPPVVWEEPVAVEAPAAAAPAEEEPVDLEARIEALEAKADEERPNYSRGDL